MKNNTWMVIWTSGLVMSIIGLLIWDALNRKAGYPDYITEVHGDVAYVFRKCDADPKVFLKAELELKNNYTIKSATSIEQQGCGTIGVRFSISKD